MGESRPEGSEGNPEKRQPHDAGQPERDRNAVEEIPRSPGATWGSGENPEKRQRRDAGEQDQARQRQKNKIQRQLDEALADSFPASDPVSIVTSNEEEDWGEDPGASLTDDRRSEGNPQRGS